MLILSIILAGAINAIAFAPNQGNEKKSNYQSQADSLRREHLTPRKSDSIEQSKSDNMPVLKTDTVTNDQKMPVAKPKNNQHMPTKEMSDTLKK